MVVIEERRQRVVARGELQEQLVQIERRQQAIARAAAAQCSARSAAVSCAASPRPLKEKSSGWNGCSTGASFALRTAHAAGKKRQAPVLARQHLQDTARVAPGPMMQHVARAQVDAARTAASFESQLLQCAGVVRPILAHLHPQVQVQALPEHLVRAAAARSGRRVSAARPWRRSRSASGPRGPPRWRRRRSAGRPPRPAAPPRRRCRRAPPGSAPG